MPDTTKLDVAAYRLAQELDGHNEPYSDTIAACREVLDAVLEMAAEDVDRKIRAGDAQEGLTMFDPKVIGAVREAVARNACDPADRERFQARKAAAAALPALGGQDRARAELGREVRTSVLERAGSRVRSAIRTVTGSGRVEPPKVKPTPASNLHPALVTAAAAAWAGTLKGKQR